MTYDEKKLMRKELEDGFVFGNERVLLKPHYSSLVQTYHLKVAKPQLFNTMDIFVARMFPFFL